MRAGAGVRGLAGLAFLSALAAPAAADDASKLVGAWRLVSWETRLADGTLRSNPMNTGSLIYSDAGACAQ
jgi:hypothetical protein